MQETLKLIQWPMISTNQEVLQTVPPPDVMNKFQTTFQCLWKLQITPNQYFQLIALTTLLTFINSIFFTDWKTHLLLQIIMLFSLDSHLQAKPFKSLSVLCLNGLRTILVATGPQIDATNPNGISAKCCSGSTIITDLSKPTFSPSMNPITDWKSFPEPSFN